MATLEMDAIVFKEKEPFHSGFFFFGGKFSSLGDQKQKRGCNLSKDNFLEKLQGRKS
jgi:hypothetical protein